MSLQDKTELYQNLTRKISKAPPFFESNILANTEGESNLGKQHQSIDPFLFIRAAEIQFPIIP